MGTTVRWNLALSEVETFLCFAAMPLAIAWGGACVCWLRSAGVTMPTAGVQSPNLNEQGTTSTLPQCSLPGALLVLFYRIGNASTATKLGPGRGAIRQTGFHAPLALDLRPRRLASRAPDMDHFMMGVD